MTSLGLSVQKYSHVLNTRNVARGQPPKVFYQQSIWWWGIIMFTGGQLLNVVAMAFAPQTMITALGSLAIVFNATFARFLLHEQVTRIQLLLMGCIISGVVLIICFTPVVTKPIVHKHAGNLIMSHFITVDFLLSASIFVLLSFVSTLVIQRFYPNLEAVLWAAITSIIASYSMTCLKMWALLLTVPESLRSVGFYVMLFFALILCAIQIHTLNIALRLGTAVTVVPIFFSLGLLFGLLQAQIAFKELVGLHHVHQAVPFVSGVVIVIASIFVLVRLRLGDEVAEREAGMDTASEHTTNVKGSGRVRASGISGKSVDADSIIKVDHKDPKLSRQRAKSLPPRHSTVCHEEADETHTAATPSVGDEECGDVEEIADTECECTAAETEWECTAVESDFVHSTTSSHKEGANEHSRESDVEPRPSVTRQRPAGHEVGVPLRGQYYTQRKNLPLKRRARSMTSLDRNAFRASFDGEERIYTVSVAGPMGFI